MFATNNTNVKGVISNVIIKNAILGHFAIQNILHSFLDTYALLALIFTSTTIAKYQTHIKSIKMGNSRMSAFLTAKEKNHIFPHKC